MKASILLALLALSACGLPYDTDGTIDRVAREGRYSVGLVAGTPAAERPRIQALVAAIARETGARPVIRTGHAERLLAEVEAGRLDLAIGAFAGDTPWADRVHFAPAIAAHATAAGTEAIAPAMKNGEHAWITLVERDARRVAALP